MGLDNLVNLVKITTYDSGLYATVKLNSINVIEETLNFYELKTFIEQNNITYGLNENVLQDIAFQPETYRNKEIEIARGISPETGADGYIEWVVSGDKDKKPIELKDGSVDFYSVNTIANTKKGELICKKVPSTEGKNGISVFGKELPAKSGKDVQLKPGKNVVLNDEKDKLYAAIDGQVVLTEEKINVFPIYEVTGDLDLSIGNINFIGTVVIRGNVPDGFKVYADGDIKVYGNVEGSELVAGGNIHIQQGIIGHNKSLIRAGKNIQAAFILDGDVFAGENLIVSQSIMHSQVSAGKQLVCNGTKGLIVGGRAQAGEMIMASSIGNYMATPTVIEVGINPELRKEFGQLLKKKEELYDNLDKVVKGLALLDKLQKIDGNLAPEKKKLQLNLINQQLVIDKEIKSLKKKEGEIEDQLNNVQAANIKVLKIINPGVKLVIGKAVKFINIETQYVKFILEDGEIVSRQI